jgi:hypothetical protein
VTNTAPTDRRLRSELYAQEVAWRMGYRAGLDEARKRRLCNRAGGRRRTDRVWCCAQQVIGFVVVAVLALAKQHRLVLGVAAALGAWLSAGVAWARVVLQHWRERTGRW